MAAKLFDGRALAGAKEKSLVEKVKRLKKIPKLVSIVVGEDKTSHLYVNLKGEAARRIGIRFEKLDWQMANGLWHIDKLIGKIEQLNKDESVTGIMVQMPLPSDLRDKTDEVLAAIAVEKDVDGLTGKGKFLPATVKAILDILSEMKVDVTGKKVVVVGRSRIVGRPLANELVRRGARVTVAHSQTPDLGAVTKRAKILVSATGRAGLITKDMVKPGAIVIDVGEPKGDVAENVREVASWVTPVPGGVGPVTVACLLENVVQAAAISSLAALNFVRSVADKSRWIIWPV